MAAQRPGTNHQYPRAALLYPLAPILCSLEHSQDHSAASGGACQECGLCLTVSNAEAQPPLRRCADQALR
jgi:hypothetical protein